MTSPHSNQFESTPTSASMARSGISFAPTWRAAVEEVVADVMARSTEAPSLAVLFIAAAWSDSYSDIVREVRSLTGTQCLIGCSSSGVIGGATCHESAPGLSLMGMWLPDATISPRRLDGDPSTWWWGDDVSVSDVKGVIMFADPYRADAQSMLVGLRNNAPGVPMVGAQASTSRSDRRVWLFLDDDVYDHGSVALTIEGPYELRVLVSQGGTPIGEPWTVTDVEYNRIISISNRPALDVMHDALDDIARRGMGASDLLVGFPMSEYQDSFSRDDFVARGILATDTVNTSLMVGCLPRRGQTIQFLARDTAEATRDLDNHLGSMRDDAGMMVGGILCTCKGRGTHMFGRNDHDAAAVAEALPDTPLVGLYSLGEIGAVCGVPAFNAFACSLGVIVRQG